MKYIRTKDGIYDKEKCCIEGQVVKFPNEWFSIIKQANTIEELCDRYVILFNSKNENDQSVLKSFKSAKSYFSRNKRYKLKHIKEIYGAIWTDKGLIYVAKMNDKGELELL